MKKFYDFTNQSEAQAFYERQMALNKTVSHPFEAGNGWWCVIVLH